MSKKKDYLDGDYLNNRHWGLTQRSEEITRYFKKYVDKDASILELGASAGRNLKFLKDEGYTDLTALEFSDKAVGEIEDFKVIHADWMDVELEEYDVIFSASFLQEFFDFPQEKFDETLSKTKKYFMIFGDAMGDWTHVGFKEVERIPAGDVFSQPIIILKNIRM